MFAVATRSVQVLKNHDIPMRVCFIADTFVFLHGRIKS